MTSSIPKTRWARTVDGACIAYQDFGEGPVTLVVIHGWVSHLEVYWEQPRYARFMRRLARTMRVLVFDKRGLGMSDRFAGSPELGILMDDARAVMDAAEVGRAAIYGWGGMGPGLAAYFAATHPDRTLALCIDGLLQQRLAPDYRWGWTDEQQEEYLESLASWWGVEEGAREWARIGFGERPEDAPVDDPDFLRWGVKWSRFAATPCSVEAFERVWFDIDVVGILGSVHVPTLVPSRRGESEEDQEIADDNASRIAGSQRVVVAGAAGVPWIDDPEDYVAALEDFLVSVQHEEAALDRRLATVMFTDVVGSTDKACRMGDACWQELLDKHNAAVRSFLARYRGMEIKTMGDGFLATFDGPARAVKCAQGICEAVKPLGLEVRAGCHTGEIELLGADVGGIAVHIGARVGALAGPSEVLVSSTVKDLVAGSGLVFEDRGEHELKGVPEPWRLYSVAS